MVKVGALVLNRRESDPSPLLARERHVLTHERQVARKTAARYELEMAASSTRPRAAQQCGDHAVVLGAGISGLLAAACLAPRFEKITIIERDPGSAPGAARKGTPQAAHIHLLLGRGAQTIESILPGVFDEISADGGLIADSTRDLAFFHFGHWQPRGQANLPARLQTRAFLEAHIARRVASIPNVDVLYGHEVRRPISDNGRVRGVTIAPPRSASERSVSADLLIDATGRGSPSPRWLTQLGFPEPDTSEVSLQITYVSRLLHAPARAADADWRAMLIYPRAPQEYRGGALYFQEDDRWIVTMASYRGEAAPHDDAGFLEFAASLPSKEIFHQIRSAEPASPIATYHYPGALRRHYERLRDRITGLVPIGDAVCSFNPVFGQGMTSAALQAEALGRCLDAGGLLGLEKRFAKAAARECNAPWLLSTTMDLRYPHARGRRSRLQPLLDAYLERFFVATASDYPAMLDFMKVLHQIAPPTRLAKPRHLATVIRNAIQPKKHPSGRRPPLASYTYSGDLKVALSRRDNGNESG